MKTGFSLVYLVHVSIKDRQGVEVGYRYTKQAKSQEQYLVSIRVLFFTISSFKVARVAVVFASKS